MTAPYVIAARGPTTVTLPVGVRDGTSIVVACTGDAPVRVVALDAKIIGATELSGSAVARYTRSSDSRRWWDRLLRRSGTPRWYQP